MILSDCEKEREAALQTLISFQRVDFEAIFAAMQVHPRSIHPSIHTYVHTYIHTYIHTSIHSFIHPSIHTYIHTSVHTSIHQSINQSINPAIHPFAGDSQRRMRHVHCHDSFPENRSTHPFMGYSSHAGLHGHDPSPRPPPPRIPSACRTGRRLQEVKSTRGRV